MSNYVATNNIDCPKHQLNKTNVIYAFSCSLRNFTFFNKKTNDIYIGQTKSTVTFTNMPFIRQYCHKSLY